MRGARGVDAVVEAIDPLDVGTEPDAARKVHHRMDIHARFAVDRIDQTAERRRSARGEINAAPKIRRRNCLRRNAGDGAGERRRAVTGAVDEQTAGEPSRFVAAYIERKTAG